jgi:CheY-like chemotaxis protein
MKKILVIDDDAIMRGTLVDILSSQNYQVKEAANGVEGLKCLDNDQFDMVVTDILMPEMDGIEFILEIREKYPNLPVMAISGGGFISAENYLNAALNLGANSLVVKPFDIDNFILKVQELV